jgi:hypothetical protein
MNRFAPALPVLASLLAAAVLVSACGKADVAPQPAASAQASAAPADACEKLKARIARCKANMKNGSVEFKLDPGADSVPELCQESEKMVDGIAQMTGCESN